MSRFAKGDTVRWNGEQGAELYEVGTIGVVDRVEIYGTEEILYVDVSGRIDGHFSWRWDYIGSKCTPDSTKTGGSTPNQYRLSVNLPLTSDRTQFADVDLEALDVIDALDLSGNLKDVQKALFRMGKKQGVSTSYDLNKCLFYILREMKKREIISHGKFWEVSEMLDKMLNEEKHA